MTDPARINADRPEGATVARRALMHCVFELRIVGQDPSYAGAAAEAVFERIEQLERRLSFFDPCSEVSRVNAAPAGEPVRVGPDTWRCRQAAMAAWSRTAGAFDPAVGALSRLWIDRPGRPDPDELDAAVASARAENISADLDRHALIKSVDGAALDFSGIAKGFALDEAATILADWDIEAALLIAGGSTVLAVGTPPDRPGWAVSLHNPLQPQRPAVTMALRDWAVSGSGAPAAGAPTFEPGPGRVADAWLAAFASDRSAAMADALSTALRAMTVDAAEMLWPGRGGGAGLLIGPEGRRGFGRWRGLEQDKS